MAGQSDGIDPEIAAISTISAALSALTDADARGRVVAYVLARFVPGLKVGTAFETRSGDEPHDAPGSTTDSARPGPPRSPEIAGVASLTEGGTLRITARDLKARSGLDGAVRLAHVAIYAYEQLAGQPLSSRKGLTPLLQEWRLYDGNTRARLAKEKGILRDGDNLRLDAHARRDAEKFIREILDESLSGQWKPK